MPHEDLQVSIGGPTAQYPDHVMHICSKGHYCLTSGTMHSDLWIHHLSIDNFRFIRDSIDNYLSELLRKEAPENETPAEVQKLGWCQSCESMTLHTQDPRDGWWRCSVPGCEAESQELTPE